MNQNIDMSHCFLRPFGSCQISKKRAGLKTYHFIQHYPSTVRIQFTSGTAKFMSALLTQISYETSRLSVKKCNQDILTQVLRSAILTHTNFKIFFVIDRLTFELLKITYKQNGQPEKQLLIVLHPQICFRTARKLR